MIKKFQNPAGSIEDQNPSPSIADLIKNLTKQQENIATTQKWSGISSIANSALDTISSALPQLDHKTAANTALDIGSQVAGMIPGPWGMGISAALKGVNLLDQALGKNATTQSTLGETAKGYNLNFNTNAGTKYGGLFGGKKRKQANDLTTKYDVANILKLNTAKTSEQDLLAARNAEQAIQSQNYNQLMGGFNTRIISAQKGAVLKNQNGGIKKNVVVFTEARTIENVLQTNTPEYKNYLNVQKQFDETPQILDRRSFHEESRKLDRLYENNNITGEEYINKFNNLIDRHSNPKYPYLEKKVNELLSKIPKKNVLDSTFIKEGNNIKEFYKNNKNVNVKVIPWYNNAQNNQTDYKGMEKELQSLSENDDVVIFGHSGNRLGRIQNEEIAKLISKSKPKNCYLGSCNFNKHIKQGFDRSGKNVYYRNDNPWLGFNPKAKTFLEGMYSRIPSEKGDIIKNFVEEGIDYKVSRPTLWEKSLTNMSKFHPLYKNGGYIKKLYQKFQHGGQMNVIPEGAFHSRLNHLPDEISEQVTPKGIPVITKEEGGELLQHSEVERNEITFNYEVSKKLEEYTKKYNEAESDKEKNEIAIELGKILTEEIMENTQDNTGLMDKIE
jgi:hypothetical protein